ncbi:MAG TPA: hypothetical protein VHC45_11025, partial [Gaiellaceae bacterium]|nr:hypothetical protein [Gaiellaceae bacterium]
MRRSLLFCLAVLALAVPAGADAAKKPSTTACRNKIINQWEGTGKIKTTYPIACYKAALKYVHGKADISTYSSLSDDIELALQAALERKKGDTSVPLDVGKHYNSKNGPEGGDTTSTDGSVTISKPPRGGAGGTPQAGSPTDGSDSGTPLPILVLGGVAIALIAAGAIGTGVRY